MVAAVRKAVIPAAGLGTRFLPATKAIPKEMLPLVDKPAIQYVVEEAVAAGLRDVLMITGRNKTALENHFDRSTELESQLEAAGKQQLLQSVVASTGLADVHYLRQGAPLGLGHAVLRAEQHVGDEAFAVLLGDDIVDAPGVLPAMLEAHRRTGVSVVALQEVTVEQLSSYGIAEVASSGLDGADTVRVSSFVEKPAPEDAPSNLAIMGRYVLRPEVFGVLRETPPGRGGEIQLTDALQVLAAESELAGGVVGLVFRGRRYDTGNKLDYLKANLEFALRRPELAAALAPWLRELLDEHERAKGSASES